MTDDAYRNLTPTQRTVRAAFKADLSAPKKGCFYTPPERIAAATGLPPAVVERTVRELRDMATAYWSGRETK